MKTIHIDLMNTESIKQALAEIREIETEWNRKAKLCCEMVAAALADQIDANLEAIPYTDDMVNVVTHEVIQKYEPFSFATAQGSMVTVRGKDLVFVEFGAGYIHNSNGAENPLSEFVSFDTDIGSYGKGQGLQPYWFVAHNLISKGTPMYMPVYRAIIAMKPIVPTMVRQVFV